METAVNISEDTFKSLISNLKPEDSNLENVFLVAEWGKHRVSVYALPEDNYNVIVEDFGFESKGVWSQLEPTSSQFEELQNRINTEVARLDIVREHESNIEDYQATEDFINVNFYTVY